MPSKVLAEMFKFRTFPSQAMKKTTELESNRTQFLRSTFLSNTVRAPSPFSFNALSELTCWNECRTGLRVLNAGFFLIVCVFLNNNQHPFSEWSMAKGNESIKPRLIWLKFKTTA